MESQGTESRIQSLISSLWVNDRDEVYEGRVEEERPDEAIGTLINIGTPAVEALIELLKNPKTHCFDYAAEILGEIQDPRAIPPLLECFKNQDFEENWEEALFALKELGHLAPEKLIEFIKIHPEPPGLDYIIEALGHIGDERAYEPVLPFLTSSNESVRITAIDAIGKLAGRKAIDYLVQALTDPSGEARDVAKWTIKELVSPREYHKLTYKVELEEASKIVHEVARRFVDERALPRLDNIEKLTDGVEPKRLNLYKIAVEYKAIAQVLKELGDQWEADNYLRLAADYYRQSALEDYQERNLSTGDVFRYAAECYMEVSGRATAIDHYKEAYECFREALLRYQNASVLERYHLEWTQNRLNSALFRITDQIFAQKARMVYTNITDELETIDRAFVTKGRKKQELDFSIRYGRNDPKHTVYHIRFSFIEPRVNFPPINELANRIVVSCFILKRRKIPQDVAERIYTVIEENLGNNFQNYCTQEIADMSELDKFDEILREKKFELYRKAYPTIMLRDVEAMEALEGIEAQMWRAHYNGQQLELVTRNLKKLIEMGVLVKDVSSVYWLEVEDVVERVETTELTECLSRKAKELLDLGSKIE